jgi:predicted dehydrogenase
MDTAAMEGTGRLRVGVIGCGDVAHRRYLPALSAIRERVEVVACCDPAVDKASRAAETVGSWSDALAFGDIGGMLTGTSPDAAFNLTPATLHADVTRECLAAGLHVYSEKPLASTLAEADELIALARQRDVHLLCAPAVAITGRFRWLARIVESGRFGPLTLAVAHYADPGPAAWREYTGDPSGFYQPGVGPVVDHGIYRLHELTLLAGPVRRVQAMGSIGVPIRTIRGGPLAGRTFEVTTPDHVLIHLEFTSGALGQLLASFGTPATRAPWLELHFAAATISFPPSSQYDRTAGADIYVDEDSPLGLEGWSDAAIPPPPADPFDLVESGAVHFVDVVRGDETPVLTAEHARHVLDVIAKTYASIDDGRAHETETDF